MRTFQTPGRSPVLAERGLCATSHPLAAAIAIDILKQGGNAVDAAIAGAVLLGQCEPAMAGLGGDCFALVSPGGSDIVYALNGSGRAPAGLDPDALRAAGHDRMPVDGAVPVTVPGAVAGFATLSERFGRLGLAASLAPAIDYAEAGVPVAPRVAFDWARGANRLTGAARTHYLANGEPLRVSDVFRQPGQAAVLRRIAEQGPDAFYQGEIAADMLDVLRTDGGRHTEADFAAQGADWTTPISSEYRGVEVVEHPPNTQGTAALLMLSILEQFDVAALDPFGADRVHLDAEAAKLAYDARDRFVADPDCMNPADRLQAPGLATRLAGLINPDRAMPVASRLTEAVHRDTIYITVVDQDRMAVSLIYSIFKSFGSGLASPKFGILLHNRGAGFTLQRGHPNEAGPRKRPMHTIIPGMLRRNGQVIMPFGVMGGHYQSAGHARFVSNIVDFGLDPQAAIDAPRSFPQDGVLELELGYSEAIRAELTIRGHAVATPPVGIGGAQAIQIDPLTGVLMAGSDPRKDGAAIGY